LLKFTYFKRLLETTIWSLSDRGILLRIKILILLIRSLVAIPEFLIYITLAYLYFLRIIYLSICMRYYSITLRLGNIIDINLILLTIYYWSTILISNSILSQQQFLIFYKCLLPLVNANIAPLILYEIRIIATMPKHLFIIITSLRFNKLMIIGMRSLLLIRNRSKPQGICITNRLKGKLK
jgi:hypothetical protein